MTPSRLARLARLARLENGWLRPTTPLLIPWVQRYDTPYNTFEEAWEAIQKVTARRLFARLAHPATPTTARSGALPPPPRHGHLVTRTRQHHVSTASAPRQHTSAPRHGHLVTRTLTHLVRRAVLLAFVSNAGVPDKPEPVLPEQAHDETGALQTAALLLQREARVRSAAATMSSRMRRQHACTHRALPCSALSLHPAPCITLYTTAAPCVGHARLRAPPPPARPPNC